MDDRGQNTLFAIVVGIIIIMSMAMLGALLMFFLGAVVVPFFDQAVNASSAAKGEGFVGPAYDVLQIGSTALLLTIAAPVVTFLLFLRLRSDIFLGRR